MYPSPELENIILKLYAGISDGTVVGMVEQIFSTGDGFLAIGTDDDQWWHDAGIILLAYQDRVRSGGGVVEVRDIEAYQEGDVGWVMDRVILKTPGSDEVPFRHTYIFHKEDSDWKIIHAHYSISTAAETGTTNK